MEFSETDSFDIVTTHTDRISYAKLVLNLFGVFFTPFGHWVRGGGGVGLSQATSA